MTSNNTQSSCAKILFLFLLFFTNTSQAQYKFKADVYVGGGVSEFSQAANAFQSHVGIQVYLPARFLLEKEFIFSQQSMRISSLDKDFPFRSLSFLAGLHFKFFEWERVRFSAGGGISVNLFDQYRFDETQNVEPLRSKETLIGAYLRASTDYRVNNKWFIGIKFTQNTLYESSFQSYDIFVKYHLTYD